MTRRPLDHYPTPARLTGVLPNHVPITGRVLEPCAGESVMAQVLASCGLPACTVFTNDIDPRFGHAWHDDAADPDAPMWAVQPDWVVTNPPYNRAAAILETAYDRARVGVAMLLRLSFLEPTFGRQTWLQAHRSNLSNLLIFGSPRPSFTDDGRTDSATVAWMVWRRDWPAVADGTFVRFVTDWNSADYD